MPFVRYPLYSRRHLPLAKSEKLVWYKFNYRFFYPDLRRQNMVCLRNISCMLKLLPGFPRLLAKLNWICLGSNSITCFKATILVTSEKVSTRIIWHKTPMLQKRSLSGVPIKLARFNIGGRISKYWLSPALIFKGQKRVLSIKIRLWNSLCFQCSSPFDSLMKFWHENDSNCLEEIQIEIEES